MKSLTHIMSEVDDKEQIGLFYRQQIAAGCWILQDDKKADKAKKRYEHQLERNADVIKYSGMAERNKEFENQVRADPMKFHLEQLEIIKQKTSIMNGNAVTRDEKIEAIKTGIEMRKGLMMTEILIIGKAIITRKREEQ
jgi:hypothetical protein